MPKGNVPRRRRENRSLKTLAQTAVWSVAALGIPLACVDCGASAPGVVLPEPDSCEPTTVPLQFVDRLPVAEVEIAGRSVAVMLDLGSYDTISLSSELTESVHATFTGRSRMSRNARGTLLRSREYRLPEARLGKIVLRDVVANEHVFSPDFAPPVQTGLIGLGVLRNFFVLIDYPEGQLVLWDRRCAAPVLPTAGSWSSTPLLSDDQGIEVTASLDGIESRMILDTGCTHSILSPDRSPQEKRVRAEQAEMFVPDVTAIGVAIQRKMAYAVLDLHGPSGVDGFLGCNFFAQNQVFIDFNAGSVSLRRADPPTPHPCPAP